MKVKKLVLSGSTVTLVLLLYLSQVDIGTDKKTLESRNQQHMPRSQRLNSLKSQVTKLRQHSLNNKRELEAKGLLGEFPLFDTQYGVEATRGRYFKSKCLEHGQAFRMEDCILQNQLNYRKNRVNKICSLQSTARRIRADRLFLIQSR